MKITRVDTLRLAEFGNLCFVEVHTDEGLIGLGETWFGPAAVDAYIHESAAPYLIGKDSGLIDRHATELRQYVGYQGSGAETRGNSAIDIALWDLLGQATQRPLVALLGGATRERIPVYNTCAGYRYVRSGGQSTASWGIGDKEEGPYEDLDAFLHRADELAHSLLDEGIGGMKIWPLDMYAEASDGQWIGASDLERGLEPFRKIRGAVGNRIEIMVELHGLWNLPMATKLVTALDEFRPAWYEDPLRPDNLDALARLADTARPVPVAVCETLTGRAAFRDLLERQAGSIAILDVAWCGGLTEAKKIAAYAETQKVPVAPHDCTGPVVLTAGTHLSCNVPNAFVQEIVRASYTGWYRELVTELPPIVDGHIAPPAGPGLGTQLLPDLDRRPDAIRRSTTLTDVGR